MAISGWGVFLIIFFIVLVLGATGWILYAHYRARQLGLPSPSINPFSSRNRDNAPYRGPAPAPGGIQGWINGKISSFRNKRTAGGAYESTGYSGGVGRRSTGDRRGFGPLDPDEAWDSRVDHEAGGYYEEQELGDPGHGPYGGGGYGNVGVGGIEQGRGRSQSRQRELDARYDEEMHGGSSSNPFGDHNAADDHSLRAVSPRPHQADTSYHGAKQGTNGHTKGAPSLGSVEDNSPTERRSMFREDV